MNNCRLIKTGLIIYVVFACLGISGIQIGVSIALLGIIGLLLKKGRIVFYTNEESKKLSVLIMVFILWAMVSTILSIDARISSQEFIRFLSEISLMFVVLNIKLNEGSKFRRKLINLLLIFCVLQSIYGVLQYFTGIDITHRTHLEPFTRIHGTLGHWNSLGGVLGMILPIMLSYTIFSSQIKQKVLYSISFIVLSLALIFTSTRGAWIGTFVGMVVILTSRYKWKTLLLIFFLPLVLLIQPVRKRLYDTLIDPDPARIYMWQKSIGMIKEKPITGYGLGTFQKLLYEKYFDEKGKKTIGVKKEHLHSHNIFLNTTVETGTLGSILLALILIFILKYAINLIKISDITNLPIVLGITGGIVDFYLHGMVDNTLRGETAYLFWFLVGILFSL